METNKFVMLTVGIVVAVVLVSGVLIPVIGNSTDSGVSAENPATTINMAYSTNANDNFSVTFRDDWDQNNCFYLNGVEISYDELDNNKEYNDNSIPIYADETTYVYHKFKLFINSIENGAFTVNEIDTLDFTLTGANGQVTITINDDNNTSPQTFNITGGYYYSKEDGEYGKYTVEQITNGYEIYVGTKPIYTFVRASYENKGIDIYRNIAAISNGADDIVTNPTVSTTDGKLTDISYVIPFNGTDVTINFDQLNDTDGWATFILPHSVGSSGTSVSPTVSTVLSIIPLFVVIGILVGIVAYFIRK